MVEIFNSWLYLPFHPTINGVEKLFLVARGQRLMAGGIVHVKRPFCFKCTYKLFLSGAVVKRVF
jgi:hypothetical protein